MMRSDSEQQWLSRMSFHRPSHIVNSLNGSDSRFGKEHKIKSKTNVGFLGSDGEISTNNNPVLMNHGVIDTNPRLRGLSLEQPTKIHIKTKPKNDPQYVNGERIDEVSTVLNLIKTKILDVSEAFSPCIYGFQCLLLVSFPMNFKS